jgi:hypothetical protein
MSEQAPQRSVELWKVNTDEQMSRVFETFEKVGKQVGLIS